MSKKKVSRVKGQLTLYEMTHVVITVKSPEAPSKVACLIRYGEFDTVAQAQKHVRENAKEFDGKTLQLGRMRPTFHVKIVSKPVVKFS